MPEKSKFKKTPKNNKFINENALESKGKLPQEYKLSSQNNIAQTQVFTWSLIGGILGTMTGMFYRVNVFIPIFPKATASPTVIILGAVLGLFFGGVLGWLYSFRYRDKNRKSTNYINQNKFSKLVKHPSLKPLIQKTDRKEKLQLREEQLEISKKLIQTGQVKIHKEINQEERNIKVPVKCEELVVEKEDLYSKEKEIIRIPLSEESIEVLKHPQVINNVSIYTKKVQENNPIREVLRKEKINVEIKGHPKIKKQ